MRTYKAIALGLLIALNSSKPVHAIKIPESMGETAFDVAKLAVFGTIAIRFFGGMLGTMGTIIEDLDIELLQHPEIGKKETCMFLIFLMNSYLHDYIGGKLADESPTRSSEESGWSKAARYMFFNPETLQIHVEKMRAKREGSYEEKY